MTTQKSVNPPYLKRERKRRTPPVTIYIYNTTSTIKNRVPRRKGVEADDDNRIKEIFDTPSASGVLLHSKRSIFNTSCGGCSSYRVSSCIAVSAVNHDFNHEADPSLANHSREFLAMDGQLFGGNSDVTGLVCAHHRQGFAR